MVTLSSVVRRFFGMTAIDSLELDRNAWYIDGVQVTATADQLNNAAVPAAGTVTAAKLGSDVDGKTLQGGNGLPLKVDPSVFHLNYTPGTNAGISVSVPGIAGGDRLVAVFAIKMTEGIYDRTSEFEVRAANPNIIVKTGGSNDGDKVYGIYWIDAV